MAWRDSVNSHKASPLGPVFGLAVVVMNGFKVVIVAVTTKLIVTIQLSE